VGAIVSGLLVSAVGAGDSGSLADYKNIKSASESAVRFQLVKD